jgi:hypothetical protein
MHSSLRTAGFSLILKISPTWALLVPNPLNRYLINSRMLPDLKLDSDGGLTLYVQNKAPAKDLQSNWLAAPNGPFYGVLRLYLPKPEVTNGEWKMPLLTPVNQQKQ